MEQQSKLSFIINVVYWLLLGALIYFSGKFLLSYLLPLLFAVAVAIISQKPARWLSKKSKIGLRLSATLTAAVIFLAIAAVCGLIIYFFVAAAKSLVGEVPDIVGLVSGTLSDFETDISGFLEEMSPQLSEKIGSVVTDMLSDLSSNLTGAISGFAADVASATPSFLFSTLVALVAGCYIAKDYLILTKFLRELFGRRVFGNILKIKNILTGSVFKMFKGYLILMFITYLELLLGFMLLGIKLAPLLALLVAVIDLLPVFGTGTVLIPWGLIQVVLGRTSFGIWLIVLYLVITLVRNFAEPKIISRQIGINPLFTLIAMFAGLKIFGFWGLVIFPVALIVVIKYYKSEMTAGTA